MTHGRDRRGENSKYITIWDKPNCAFPSQYGYITYRQWCVYEIVRLAVIQIIVHIVEGKRQYRGMICLSL